MMKDVRKAIAAMCAVLGLAGVPGPACADSKSVEAALKAYEESVNKLVASMEKASLNQAAAQAELPNLKNAVDNYLRMREPIGREVASARGEEIKVLQEFMKGSFPSLQRRLSAAKKRLESRPEAHRVVTPTLALLEKGSSTPVAAVETKPVPGGTQDISAERLIGRVVKPNSRQDLYFYISASGRKHLFQDAQVYQGCGFKFDEAVVVRDAVIESLPNRKVGPTVQHCNVMRKTHGLEGELVRARSGTLFLVAGGTKHVFGNPRSLAECTKGEDIVNVPDQYIESIVPGQPMPGEVEPCRNMVRNYKQ